MAEPEIIDDAKDMISSENPKTAEDTGSREITKAAEDTGSREITKAAEDTGSREITKAAEDAGSRKNSKIAAGGKKKKKFRILIVIAAAVAAVVFLIAVLTPKDLGYAKIQAEKRDIYTYDSFVGNVQPSETQKAVPKVSAEVTEVDVEKGDKVSAGDVIAKLDTTAVENNIALKEAALSTTDATAGYNVKDAQKAYDDYKYGIDNGLNETLTTAKNQLDTAESAYENAVSAYNSAGTSIDNGTNEATTAVYEARSQAGSARDQALSALNEAQAAVAAAATEEEAAAARTSLAAAQKAFDQADSAWNSACTSFDNTAASVIDSLKKAADQAEETRDQAKKGYDAASLQVNQQLATLKATLEKAEALSDTEESRLELQNLKDSLKDYVITAPVSGTVESLDIKAGDMAAPGTSVATVSDMSSMEIKIKIDEYSIMHTEVGSAVKIYIDSVDKTYDGTMTQVADTATVDNGVSYYEAVVKFDKDENVRGGMSVEVRVTSVDDKDVLTLPVTAVVTRTDNTSYVLVPDKNGNPVEKDVTLGASDGSYIEITEGLSEGDTVLETESSAYSSGMGSMRDTES